MGDTLYIGSSLTGAFHQWFNGPGADRRKGASYSVMCHGAFWTVSGPESGADGRPVIDVDGTVIALPFAFDVRQTNGALSAQKFYGHFPPGVRVENRLRLDMATFDTVVFTAPMLFPDLSYSWLHKAGYGVLTDQTADDFAQAGLRYPLSGDLFCLLHAARFSHAYRFLAQVRAVAPGIRLFIAPAALPTPAKTNFPDAWRGLNAVEMDLVFAALAAQFDAHPMPQPAQTLLNGRATDPAYLADDQHHYNTDFVDLLFAEHGF